MKKINLLLVLFVGFSLIGCAAQSAYMKPAGLDVAGYRPDSNEAAVIFMRPSRFGGAIQSSVFDVTTEKNVLIGIVSSKTKLVYKTSPGKHLFMVVSESADFMGAELEGGKTYYAIVTPRMGVWRARFSLSPVRRNEINTNEFKTWESSCKFVAKLASADKWAQDNAQSIQSKRKRYYDNWISRDNRPFLKKEDGI